MVSGYSIPMVRCRAGDSLCRDAFQSGVDLGGVVHTKRTWPLFDHSESSCRLAGVSNKRAFCFVLEEEFIMIDQGP